MKQTDTQDIHVEEDTKAYVAPKLTVLDAGKTASGGFPSPTEGPFSNEIS